MKIGSFPSLSPHRNHRFASNTNFNSINGKEKNLYFLDTRINISLKNKLALKKSTNKQKLFSESTTNLKNNQDNLLPNIEGKRFIEDEKDFETWKKKQIIKMSEEMKNAVKNNEILLQQKKHIKKNLNRDDKHFLSVTQSDRNLKTAGNQISGNDEIFNYFADLDSIINNSKMKFDSIIV